MSTAALQHPTAPNVHETAHPRRWSILAVLCTSLVVVMIGNSSLNIALPEISQVLGASNSQLQWIVDAYALVFAGLLFTAGSLGDRFGRKGALQLGLAIFLVATVAASTADSARVLIVCRGAMGFGAAFVMPATLSIIVNVFPTSERAKAIAIWTAIAGVGGSLGPIASGLLLVHFSWSSVFLVNVPVVVLALGIGMWVVPTSRDPGRPGVDPLGALLSTAGIVTLVYAIIEAPGRGWTSSATLGTAFAAFALIAAFAGWELHSAEPMLDLRYFRHAGFAVGSIGVGLVFFALFGFMFLMTQYMQMVLGYSPLGASLRMLPFVFVMLAIAPRTPGLVVRLGAQRVVGTGMFVVAAGMFLVSRLGISTGYAMIATTMVIIATGMALTMAPLTNSILAGVPRAKAGIGSAMNDTTRELGGALGIAVLGSLVTSQFSSSLSRALASLPPQAAAVARTSLAGALSVAARMGPAGEELARAARQAFVDGMSIAVTAGAAVIAVAAVTALRFLPAQAQEVEATRTDESTEVDELEPAYS